MSVLQQYDYDSSTVRKKISHEALVSITLPFIKKKLAPTYKTVSLNPPMSETCTRGINCVSLGCFSQRCVTMVTDITLLLRAEELPARVQLF